MRLSLPLVLLLAVPLLSATGCGGPPPVHKALKRTAFGQDGASVPRLFIAAERDRSGGRYLKMIDEFELESFKERFTNRLMQPKLRFDSYDEYGQPREVKLVNPFQIVGDSTDADLVLELFVDGIEEGTVEVTGDRIAFWTGFGITQYTEYQRVPRVLVALSAQVRDPKTRMSAYEVRARGVAVNRNFRREGFDVAMRRCELRFYERLLAR